MPHPHRNKIIADMCYTYRHDFGLIKEDPNDISSGVTLAEQKMIWNTMSQIFDNVIAPYLEEE